MAASQWSAHDFAAYIESSQFTTTRLRPGYDEREVDDFLDRVVATLRGEAAQPMTPQDVVAVAFSTTRFRPGYDEEDVDRLLETVKSFFQGY